MVNEFGDHLLLTDYDPGQPAVEAIMKYWRLPPGQTETWSFVEPWYVGRLRVKTPDGNWVLVEIQCEDRNPHMTGVREVAAYLGGHDVGLDHDDERWDAAHKRKRRTMPVSVASAG